MVPLQPFMFTRNLDTSVTRPFWHTLFLDGAAEVFRSRSRLARGARLALSASVAVSALALVVFHAALFWNQIGDGRAARPGRGGALGRRRAAARRPRGARPRGRAACSGAAARWSSGCSSLSCTVTAAPATDLAGTHGHRARTPRRCCSTLPTAAAATSCLRPRSSCSVLLRARARAAQHPRGCASVARRPLTPTRQSSASTSPRARLPSCSPDRARPVPCDRPLPSTSARGLWPWDAHVRCARCRARTAHAGAAGTRPPARGETNSRHGTLGEARHDPLPAWCEPSDGGARRPRSAGALVGRSARAPRTARRAAACCGEVAGALDLQSHGDLRGRCGDHGRGAGGAAAPCSSCAAATCSGPGPHRYLRSGPAVATHLLRVACGLDSMVLGDVQILGQVKDAYAAGAPGGHGGRAARSPARDRAARRQARARRNGHRRGTRLDVLVGGCRGGRHRRPARTAACSSSARARRRGSPPGTPPITIRPSSSSRTAPSSARESAGAGGRRPRDAARLAERGARRGGRRVLGHQRAGHRDRRRRSCARRWRRGPAGRSWCSISRCRATSRRPPPTCPA